MANADISKEFDFRDILTKYNIFYFSFAWCCEQKVFKDRQVIFLFDSSSRYYEKTFI